jgi:hypothetical protein
MQLHHVSIDAAILPFTLAPQTTERLLAVSPDMAEFLAVVTLRETSLARYACTLIAVWKRLVHLNIGAAS